jgi:Plavaka transposase
MMQGWSQSCLCGRIFTQTYAYTNHSRNCKKTKTGLSSALEKAKERYYANKRRKTGVTQYELEAAGPRMEEAEAPGSPLPAAASPSNDHDAPPSDNTHQACSSAPNPHSALSNFLFCQDKNSLDDETLHLPLAERRTRREHRQLPKRYQDLLPEPPPALPPPSLPEDTQAHGPQYTHQQSQAPVSLPDRKVLKSGLNGFGLFRQYFAASFPSHDPGERITHSDLIESPNRSLSVHPYPNLSSFLIGEWYWNGGEKKSQASFEQLIKIVGHPEFRPEDVAGNNWRLIDAQLSGGHIEGLNKEDDWEDEQVSRPEGWIKTPIKIKVPFHKKMKHPGQKEFDAGILHHRKLMSVIRERITRPSVHPHLHFEPYELFWQPSATSEPTRVHGELYTSEAFIEAHNTLQEQAPEPGCNLPRAVLGLMFASDGTQLTSFSTAKLWPVYLTIGNESKYRRSKPSCQAFEHVAYLESASETFCIELYVANSHWC